MGAQLPQWEPSSPTHALAVEEATESSFSVNHTPKRQGPLLLLMLMCGDARGPQGSSGDSPRSLAGGPAVLLDLLLDVGQLVLQVLTPLPLLQVCWILQTGSRNALVCLLLKPAGEGGPKPRGSPLPKATEKTDFWRNSNVNNRLPENGQLFSLHYTSLIRPSGESFHVAKVISTSCSHGNPAVIYSQHKQSVGPYSQTSSSGTLSEYDQCAPSPARGQREWTWFRHMRACACVCVYQWLHHLAGRLGGQVVHHSVHLLELAGHGLDLGVELPVLCVLVVEDGPVLVPLLIALDAGVLAEEPHGDTVCVLSCSAPEPPPGIWSGTHAT